MFSHLPENFIFGNHFRFSTTCSVYRRNWPPLCRDATYSVLRMNVLCTLGKYVNCSFVDLASDYDSSSAFFFFRYFTISHLYSEFYVIHNGRQGVIQTAKRTKTLSITLRENVFIIGGQTADVNFNRLLLFCNYALHLHD